MIRDDGDMCRNITILRGLEPAATAQEIEAAARQYVRKVSGVTSTSAATQAAFDRAVFSITQATTALLAELPPRRQPPPTLPPLRRRAAAAAAVAAVVLATGAVAGCTSDGEVSSDGSGLVAVTDAPVVTEAPTTTQVPTEATPLVRQAVTDDWAAQLRCQQRPQACRPGSFTAAQGALRGEIAAAVTTLLTNGWHRGEADEADGGYVAVGPVTIGPDGTTATADECVYDPVPLLDAGGDVVNSVAVPRRIVHTVYLESGTWAVGDEQIDPSAACDLTPDSIPSDHTVPTS